MSLNITATEIQIQNALGIIKFTSNNKLVYPRASKTGTITISSASISIPFTTMSDSEFLSLSFKINSCDGNVGSALIGTEIPANGSIITKFYGRAVNNTPAADTDYMGALLIGDQLVFRAVKAAYNTVSLTASDVTTNLTYKATIFSYL
jgi:hypothetical protein